MFRSTTLAGSSPAHSSFFGWDPSWSLPGVYHEGENGAGAGAGAAGSGEASTSTQAGTEPGNVNPAQPQDVNGGGQRQSEHVPYDRFREVNEPWQQLKGRAQQYGYDNPLEYTQALEEAYERLSTGQQPQDGPNDPYGGNQTGGQDPRLETVEQAVTRLLFDQQFGQLRQQYPQADADQVWSWMSSGRFQGANALQRAANLSHTQREAERQRIIAEHIEGEKKRQSAAVEGAGGGVTTGGLDWKNMPADEFKRRQEQALKNL